MARLVRRDTDGGKRSAVVILRGKKQRLLHRIVMVGEMATHFLDWHLMEPGGVQYLSRGFGPTQPACVRHLGESAIDRHQFELRIEAEKNSRQHNPPVMVEDHFDSPSLCILTATRTLRTS